MKKIIAAIIVFTVMMSFSSFATINGGDEMTNKNYKNTVETEISAYAHDWRGNVEGFGYNVPLKIHYNDSYKTERGYSITINEFKVIDGVPSFSVTMETEIQADVATCRALVRCYTSEDGIYTDFETESIGSLLASGVTQITDEPLIGINMDRFLKENKITSIEIWIDEYDYSQK